MRTLTVFILVFLLSDSIFAQHEKPIRKGSFVAGGSISLDFNRSKYFDPTYSQDVARLEVKTFTITPQLDLKYLITDHVAIGIITEDFFSFSRTKDRVNNNGLKDNVNDLFIGPLIRYYTKSNFFLLASAQIGGYERIVMSTDKQTIKQRKYLFSTGIGYSVFVSKSVAIESTLSYNYLYSEFTKVIEQEEKRSGIEFLVGIQLILNFKKLNSDSNEN